MATLFSSSITTRGINEYIPLTTSMPDEFFTRFEESIWLTPLTTVLDRETLQAHGLDIEAVAAKLEWPDGAWRLFQAAAVHFVFYNAIPSMDLNATGAGFAVTSTQGLAPASVQRVVRLMRRVQRYAYDNLAAAYTLMWGRAAPRWKEVGLRAYPLRGALACDPDQWRHLCGELPTEDDPECPIVSLSHAFFTQGGILRDTERDLMLSLISTSDYESIARAESLGENLPQGVQIPFDTAMARRAIYLEAYARLLDSLGRTASAARFHAAANREMQEIRRAMGINPRETDYGFFLA